MLLLAPLPATAEMRGHGGPVRALAISPDGKTAVSGSFDTTVIIWDLEREIARQVLRFHEGPVNAVAFSSDQKLVITGSDDGRVALWDVEQSKPIATFDNAGTPVVGVASVGASSLHTDRTIRAQGTILTTLPEDPIALAQARGRFFVATRDAKIHVVPGELIVTLKTNANTLATAPDGEIIAGGADGTVYALNVDGTVRLAVAIQDMPITSLGLSADGTLIAAAGLRGAVKIIDRATGRDIATLVGPGLPVWSLAFHPDGRTLYTGGADRMIRKWDVATGQPSQPANTPRADFPPSAMNERGAQLFRACDACHTVTPDGGNRAGPTLHGVFGRKIGTAQGYIYSAGFAGHGLTWNAQTITRLFREGPSVVTPGTKMPEQRVTDEEDLKALVEWLERVTR